MPGPCLTGAPRRVGESAGTTSQQGDGGRAAGGQRSRRMDDPLASDLLVAVMESREAIRLSEVRVVAARDRSLGAGPRRRRLRPLRSLRRAPALRERAGGAARGAKRPARRAAPGGARRPRSGGGRRLGGPRPRRARRAAVPRFAPRSRPPARPGRVASRKPARRRPPLPCARRRDGTAATDGPRRNLRTAARVRLAHRRRTAGHVPALRAVPPVHDRPHDHGAR